MSRFSALTLGFVLAGVFAVSNAYSEDAPKEDPMPNSEAVVLAGNARFTVLTSALIRLEWSKTATFEDRATFAFINRDLAAPNFRSTRDDHGNVTIETDDLLVVYDSSAGRFDETNLSITVKNMIQAATWHPGMSSEGNLHGTVRTLDSISGSIPLPDGLLSRDGWSVVDESGKWVFDNSDWPWAVERSDVDATDWYFFGYGHDYKRALLDFAKVSGKIPMPPRYALGAWWSRYWAYSDAELRDLVKQFHEHDVPLDVLVVDMDWHKDGWTGYSWNRELFPDPEGYLDWVHGQGLRTTLNLHPHDGVGKQEDAFPDVVRAMGLDPKTTDRVPFEVHNRRYIDAYFKYLHHPLERMGVDFWWMDWQQGSDSGLDGLDPLTWLNYLHWTDWVRNPDRRDERPLIFSRWGGLGNHRYEIGFSGDTYCNWESLAFQPYFTSTAGNVGYAWWSHDIGGHQPGPVNPELYARWIQWGALSPILRTHTTKNPEAERRIWAFDEEIFQVCREAYRLRYALAPYVYTSARHTHDEAVPIVRPLYHDWPDLDEAYENGGEYLFGNDMLVAPVVRPMDPLSRRAQVDVWFPPGEWVNHFTGGTFVGPASETLFVPLDEIPLFVRSGAIIPTAPVQERLGVKPFGQIVFNVHPGTTLSGKTRLYEDDNVGRGYAEGECAWTAADWSMDGNRLRFVLHPSVGVYKGQPERRDYELVLHDVWPAEQILVNGSESDNISSYDESAFALHVKMAGVARDQEMVAEVHFSDAAMDRSVLLKGARGRCRELRAAAQQLGAPLPGSTGNLRDDAKALLDWNLSDLLAEYATRKGDDEQFMRTFAHLAGLQANSVIRRIPGRGNGLSIDTTLGLMNAVPGLSARIQYGLTSPWKLEGSPMIDAGTIPGGTFSHSTRAAADAPNAVAGDIVIRYVYTLGGKEFSADQTVHLFPSIPVWQVAGPFDNPDGFKLDTVFPPEKGVDLSATYEGKGGMRVAWRPVHAGDAMGDDISKDFIVNFERVFGSHNDDAVAYAAVWIHASEERDAVLAVGSDDGVVVWLNGEELHRNAIGRPYTSRDDIVPVHLKIGCNALLLKISQGNAGWEFAARLEDAAGAPLRGVTYGLGPD